jgi:hypothetical protein
MCPSSHDHQTRSLYTLSEGGFKFTRCDRTFIKYDRPIRHPPNRTMYLIQNQIPLTGGLSVAFSTTDTASSLPINLSCITAHPSFSSGSYNPLATPPSSSSHRTTRSPSFAHPPKPFLLPAYASEPCLTLRKSRGPMIQMLPRSRTRCTLGRRPLSLDLSSALFYTVRRPICPPVSFPLTLSVRSAILGIVIVLFFHCMAALLNPANRRGGGVKWGLVAYTAVMFSFVTVYTAGNLNVQSIAFIDNREFSGVSGVMPPGPTGYQLFIYSKAISIVPNLMFLLNNWMADGLLVSFALDPPTEGSNVRSSFSSIVAMLSMP